MSRRLVDVSRSPGLDHGSDEDSGGFEGMGNIRGCPMSSTEDTSDFKTLDKEICDKLKLEHQANDKEYHSVILPMENSKRWDKIKQTLKAFIKTPRYSNFKYTIDQYNDKQIHFYTFGHYVDHESINKEELNFQLSKIAKCALNIESIKKPIRLLVKGEDASLTLTESQMCCLLANAFFCTFPEQRGFTRSTNQAKGKGTGSGKGHQTTYSSVVSGRSGYQNSSDHSNSMGSSFYGDRTPKMPTFNFFGLHGKEGSSDPDLEVKFQKMKCVMHYFNKVLDEKREKKVRNVTFHRQVVCEPPHWSDSNKPLSRVKICSKGLIESARLFLQVDFANKMVGGGVLGRGCVQEEIRFVLSPELIVSRLITEELDDNECLVVTGVERFSKYTGYSKTFKWTGDLEDDTPMDSNRRKRTQIVIMDAQKYSYENEQFDATPYYRELNKAYCGFSSRELDENERPAVATGNWGCGAFKGNKELKFLVQLLAASESSRDILYFTFNDREFTNRANNMHKQLQKSQITVGELCKLIERTFNGSFPSRYSSHRKGREETKFFDILMDNMECQTNLKTKHTNRNPSQKEEPQLRYSSKDELQSSTTGSSSWLTNTEASEKSESETASNEFLGGSWN